MSTMRHHHLKRFGSDQRGSELVQFTLVLPLLITIVWGAFEIYQLASLRSVARTTATQLAHYMSSYGAPQPEAGYAPDAGEICSQIEALAASSLSEYQGPLGDSVTASIQWYRILDPHSSRWEGNIEQVDCYALLANQVCNEQFAVVLGISVPWQTIIFGLDGNTVENWTLNMSETAMGAAPCLPYFTMDIGGGVSSGGPGGCVVEVCWSFHGSYDPDRVEVYADDDLVAESYNPVYDNCARVTVPVGVTQIKVVAYGGQREDEDSFTVQCP